MKKLIYIFFAVVLLAAMGCEEIGPDISVPGGNTNTSGNDDLEDQPRQVLIEEFTGVRCVNCPEGSAQIETMLDNYGSQLVAISVHSGFFAPPHSASLYDFQTPDGDAILDYVGQPIGFPTAVVNRKLFTGESELQVGQSSWNGHVATELQEVPKIKIGVEPTFNSGNRELTVDLTFLPTEAFSNENLRYTVILTENNIVDYQTVPGMSEPQADYVHKHVFRDVITANFDGDPITDAILPNVSFQKSLTYTLPNEWDEKECSVIAFVNYSGATKEILQVAEAHVE